MFGEAAKTVLGFFWKSGWAFVLGYFISAMIQAFVPKGRLTPYLGGDDAKSVGLATAFGAISSSCSFAALTTARALVMKGALYIAAVMYVSIVATALILHYGFAFLGITLESVRAVKEVAQFKLNYTLWMNLAAVGLVGWLSWLNRSWHFHNEGMDMEMAAAAKLRNSSPSPL